MDVSLSGDVRFLRSAVFDFPVEVQRQCGADRNPRRKWDGIQTGRPSREAPPFIPPSPLQCTPAIRRHISHDIRQQDRRASKGGVQNPVFPHGIASRLNMPPRNGLGDALPALHRLLRSTLKQLCVQQVQHKQLGHAGRNGPGLKRPLIGAALEHQVRFQSPGGLGKAGD